MDNTDVQFPAFQAERPILLVDADEVLLRFVEHLERHLDAEGYELRLTSFQLGGNIYDRQTAEVAPQHRVKELIATFFDLHVETVPAIDHAADALLALSDVYEIAILTNVPHRHRARRQSNLQAHGFHYPVIANSGGKGPAVKHLQAITRQPIFFVDDLPSQISSVAQHAPDTHIVHFIGDARLAKLIGKAPQAHARIDDWRILKDYLLRRASSLKPTMDTDLIPTI